MSPCKEFERNLPNLLSNKGKDQEAPRDRRHVTELLMARWRVFELSSENVKLFELFSLCG